MPAKIAIFREDEAGQKWCPHTVASHTDPRARAYADGDHLNGDGAHTGPFYFGCMGEKCSQWRWYLTHIDGPGPERDLVPNGETYGYCGLAGSPEPQGRR